jgi:predicted GNAT family acetyltransferase
MLGYFHNDDGASGLDEAGWFPSGDIVAVDDDGHYRLVDRKKEIYKNRKGQTIVPQRIENLFRDFDVVSQAFLVGDQLEYNTLLIWPNHEGHPELKHKSDAELRDLIGSLVVSANRFLARYERVVAFELLPRALAEAEGELTPKGTFKRQVVRDRWRELYEPMYRDRYRSFDVDGVQIRIPDSVLRAMGVVKDNLALRDGVLYALDRPLVLQRDPECPGTTRVGDFHYRTASSLDLGALLSRPSVWLGNDQLVQFLGEEAFHALISRRHEPTQRVDLAACEGGIPSDARAWDLAAGLTAGEATPSSVHAAAVLMRLPGPQAAAAVAHLERGSSQRHSGIAGLCRDVLRRAADASDREVVRLAFRALVSVESDTELLGTVERFLAGSDAGLLSEDDLQAIAERGLPDSHMQLLVDALSSHASLGGDAPRPTPAARNTLNGVMRIVSAVGVSHPEWYARGRFPLARLALHADETIAARAGEQLDRLQLGFRVRIGTNLRLAVDPDSGEEYAWRDVLVFDDEVTEAHRKLITKAITETTLVRESVFLFGKGALLSLSELPRRSTWVSLLGSKHGKSVYRVSIQTRDRGAFDVALNLAETIPVAELREEIGWLMAAGDDPPLSELFGGYFPEYGIFTEEFIPGETVERQVARLLRLGAVDRLRALWPFLVWSGLGVHIDFWERSGRTLALRQPAPSNVIIPSHDYHVGARLISISDRSPCTTIDDLLQRFEDAFIRPMASSTPELAQLVSPVILLSAFVETLGLERGLALLASAKEGVYGSAIVAFLEAVKARGYMPKRLYFASQRYARWIAVNPAATVEARADMLRELWDTYGLGADEARYADTRIRFFRQTVFKEARHEVVSELDRLMAAARAKRMSDEHMSEQVAASRGAMRPTEEEDYFLARMTYRHLRPTDEAAIISLPTGSTRVTDVAVSLHDHEGGRFRVRGPVSPRDVGRLLDLFHKASLLVSFATEHEFLLAIDDADHVIGGMFYRRVDDETVYLEKIVVSRRHRKKGISDGLMREFMRRVQSRGGKVVETGFFRPEYLLRFGFRTDARSSGLVRDLAAQPIERASRSVES